MCKVSASRSSASPPIKRPSRDRQPETPRFGPRFMKPPSCLGRTKEEELAIGCLSWTKEEDLAIGKLDFKSGIPVSTNKTQPSVIQSGSTDTGQGTAAVQRKKGHLQCFNWSYPFFLWTADRLEFRNFIGFQRRTVSYQLF